MPWCGRGACNVTSTGGQVDKTSPTFKKRPLREGRQLTRLGEMFWSFQLVLPRTPNGQLNAMILGGCATAKGRK